MEKIKYLIQDGNLEQDLYYCSDIEGLRQKFLSKEKYKGININEISKYTAHISDKGNLVLTLKYIYFHYTNEAFNRELEAKKRRFETALNNHDFKVVKGLKKHNGLMIARSIQNVDDMDIHTKKLVFTTNGNIYFIPKMNSVRRLSLNKKEHCEKIYEFLRYNFMYHRNVEYQKQLRSFLKKASPLFAAIETIEEKETTGQIVEYFFQILISGSVKELPKFIIKSLKAEKDKKLYGPSYFYVSSMYTFAIKKLKMKNVEAIKSFIFDCSNDFFRPRLKVYFEYLKEAYKNTNVNVETVLVNRLNQKNSMEIRDSLEMFAQAIKLLKKYPDKNLPPLKKNFHKMNFKEAHNYLSRYLREIMALANACDYNYSEEVFGFEKVVDNYSFELVRSSRELIAISRICSNCVAGYNQQIKRGNSIIVYGNPLNDDTKPLCIELSPCIKRQENSEKFNPRYYSYYGYNGRAARVVRQCFYPHNETVKDDKTINILKSYFQSIDYDWASYNEIHG